MPDYKEMYLMMMRETEKAIQTLVQVQRACEELYLQDEGPVLRIFPGQNEGTESRFGDTPEDGPK